MPEVLTFVSLESKCFHCYDVAMVAISIKVPYRGYISRGKIFANFANFYNSRNLFPSNFTLNEVGVSRSASRHVSVLNMSTSSLYKYFNKMIVIAKGIHLYQILMGNFHLKYLRVPSFPRTMK